MSGKLTCRMSDGTEWEVRCQWNQLGDPESKIMVVEPIKREPREGYHITRKAQPFIAFETREEAQKNIDTWNSNEDSFEIIKVCEVIE